MIRDINEQPEFLGRTVRVYRNLNRNCMSVVDNSSKLVIAHTSFVLLDNPVFKVSEAGRQRVLRTGRRNVHAWAVGEISEMPSNLTASTALRLSYNPYRDSSFMATNLHDPENIVPIYHARIAMLGRYSSLAYI
jgi:hypothetical protein